MSIDALIESALDSQRAIREEIVRIRQLLESPAPATGSDGPRLYSLSETAERLDVDRQTVTRLRLAGLLPCVLIGTSPKFSDTAIAGYIAAREAEWRAAIEADRQPSPPIPLNPRRTRKRAS